MPLNETGSKILKSMEKTYGPEKAERVLYASENAGVIPKIHDSSSSENKGTISGIHDSERDMTTVADAIKSCMDAVEALHRRVDAYTARRDSFHEQPTQNIADSMKACADAVENLERRVDAYCARRADDHRVIGGVQLDAKPLPGGLTSTAYKGYLIKEDFRGNFHVSKGGSHITTQSSLEEAKKQIENLV
jgi:hypothetical protein